MEKIGLPKITETKIDAKTSKFVVEPLYPGYGPTIGNAMRRVLLSSVTGTAATSFKVDGVDHEFSSIAHVKEDMIELMMNLKSINFKSFSDEPVIIELTKKGPGEVTAADFSANSNIEIANPEQHIVSLDNKANFHLELTVEKDRGFRPANHSSDEKREIGQISIDASFAPIDRVSLEVGDTRVGQMTNYDKITLEVITNGTIEPSFAIKEAAKVLVDHFTAIISDENFDLDLTQSYSEKIEESEMGEDLEGDAEGEDGLDGKIKIEEANFSPRTTNALINASVKTIAGLKRLSPLKLEEIKGLGKKGIEEINEKLGL